MVFCAHCGVEVEYPKLCPKCGPICHPCADKPCPHKVNKWHNIHVTTDAGLHFASKIEYQRYLVLKDMQEHGEVDDLKLQPRFVLLEGFTARGKKFKPVVYRADFSYIEGCESANYVVEDVKGEPTPEFIIKEKMFRTRWPEIDFRVGDQIYEMAPRRIW